jgi:hypothetical protein
VTVDTDRVEEWVDVRIEKPSEHVKEAKEGQLAEGQVDKGKGWWAVYQIQELPCRLYCNVRADFPYSFL